PEAQAARAAAERRERTEKELTKERERAGLRRDMPLHRTYFHDIAQPAKIPALLEKLVEFTGSTEFREYHPIKQAATFQFQFLEIFPFSEHSGKVGRMASNLVLQRNGYLPCVIHSIDRQRYYEAFRGTASGFRTLLMDAMENSLDNGLKFFRDQARRYRAIN
ncbi:MAG TPA: Fic family protein, partial [Myxococcaceae bacterium]|nr:Fic family protein [Myxococcaceae bacterium]